MNVNYVQLFEKTKEDLLKERINNEKIFVCDYITFQFQRIEERDMFLTIVEQILQQKIILQNVALTGLDRYSIPKVAEIEILALSDYNLRKRGIYYLSFFGRHSLKVYNILFNQKILDYANKTPYNEKRIEIQRVDYKTFLNVEKDCSESCLFKPEFLGLLKKKDLDLDIFTAPYLSLAFELVKLTANLMLLEDLQRQRRQTFETSKTGWTIDLGNNKKTWKTRIYYRIPDNTIVNPDYRISLEIQLTKSLTNKLTFFWKRKAFNEFVEKSLFLYITAMNDVQKSTITELYDLLILPKLNSYLNDVKEEKLLNNSIVNPINCIATQNFKQFNFCLENTNEFVSFLALYRQIIIHSKEKLWKLEKYLVIPFQNVKNIETFKFLLPDLLLLVGWEKTPHYILKMKKNLLNLQNYAIYSSNSQFARSDGFHSLITSLTVTNLTVELSINMRVLVTLIEPISNVDLSIFSVALSAYYQEFEGYYKKKVTKKTYPSYFYSLIAQTLSSLENNIEYTGNFPTSGKAIKHFHLFTLWLFTTLLPKFTNQKVEIIKTEKYLKFISIKTTNGSFTYPNF